METLVIIYLLKVSICVALSYVFYSILLKRSTHFQANRFFLLFTLLISFAIPFLKITPPKVAEIKDPTPTISDYFYPIAEQSEVLQYQFAKPLRHPTPIFQISIGELLFLIYICVSIFFALRFCKQCWTLSKIIGESVRKQESKYDVLYHPDMQISSFFHFLFWRKTGSKSSELIFLHERTHMYQWHSLDILILEVAKIVLWFNPFVALFKKELALLHEFIADREVIRTTHNKKSYLQVLLSQSGQPAFRLTHHFNSYITKRLKMLDRKKSHALTHSFYILYIPLLVSMVIAFNPDASNDHLISSSIDKLGDVTSRQILSVNVKDQESGPLYLEWGNQHFVVRESLSPVQGRPKVLRNHYSATMRINKSALVELLDEKLVFNDRRKKEPIVFALDDVYNITLVNSSDGSIRLKRENFENPRSTSFDHLMTFLKDNVHTTVDESRIFFQFKHDTYPCAIHIIVDDPETRKTFLGRNDKRYTLESFVRDPNQYHIPGGRKSTNVVSYQDMIDLLLDYRFTLVIDEEERGNTCEVAYLDDIYVPLDREDLVEELKKNRSIERPIAVLCKANNEGKETPGEYISIFDDERNTTITIENWSTFFEQPFTVKLRLAEIIEKTALKWGPLELKSPRNSEFQDGRFYYKGFTNAHLRKNDNRVEKSYIKRVLRNAPTLSVNNSEVKDFSVSFRYIDHVGVPFNCSLFYKNGQLTEGAECVEIVRERIKPDDFIEKLTVWSNGQIKLLNSRIKIK